MRKFWRSLLIASALFAAAGSVQAHEVRLTLNKVRSNTGNIMVSLCGDPKGQFPGGCSTYPAMQKAQAGDTVVIFDNVAAGTYAVQAFHDENGNYRPDIPPEGFAFGNDAIWPPSFEAASIKVAGDVQASAMMIYGPGPEARQQGSKGADAPPGVRRIELREEGLYGAFYAPTSAEPVPALILVGGSEGGLDTISNMAVSFAKQGYAALALAYWAEQGLPQSLELIPLEYFDRALAWVKARPETRGRAVAAIGWSRGSEAAMLLGSRNKEVRAVLAIAPSGIVWSGLNFADPAASKAAWTVEGRPLPFVAPTGSEYRAGKSLLPVFTSSLPDADRRPETIIPVERINGPLMLVSGSDDQLWPSAEFGERVVARLKGAHFPHKFEHLVYEGAGHAVFVGEPDGNLSRLAGAPNPMMGGSPEANRRAWADNWPRALAFLDEVLKGTEQ